MEGIISESTKSCDFHCHISLSCLFKSKARYTKKYIKKFHESFYRISFLIISHSNTHIKHYFH